MGRNHTPASIKRVERIPGAKVYPLTRQATAYTEPCGGEVRLTLYVGAAFEFTGRYPTETAALKAARERVGGGV